MCKWIIQHCFAQFTPNLNFSKYPTLYATKDDLKDPVDMNEYNAVQRAHANFLENHPQFLLLLFVSGATTPQYSATAGAIYLVGRIVYAIGYTGANPNGRLYGAFGQVALLYLLGGSIYTGLKLTGHA